MGPSSPGTGGLARAFMHFISSAWLLPHPIHGGLNATVEGDLAELDTVHDVMALRAQVAEWRRGGETIALVPTMGALHAGHLSLVDVARAEGATRIVVSIFVNPTQFAPAEDFNAYPRPIEADLAALAERHVDLAYLPAPATMYPDGFVTTVSVGGPIVADLEAAARPSHFAGVATVVAKLLIQSGAAMAVFGEKDYQQLLVVKRMARDLDIPCRIVGAPVIRDDHGLALSSRNAYLDARQLAIARQLNVIMGEIAASPASLHDGKRRLLAAGFDAVDYLDIRDADSLAAPIHGHPARLLAVARIGSVRLLDNMAVTKQA